MRPLRPLLIAAVFTAFAASAPAALADNVSISVSSSAPEQGIPVTVTLSGSGTGTDADGDGPYLYAVARPSGGVGCQSSFGADQEAAGQASSILIDGDAQTPGQAFSEQASFDPDQGGSIICAWLETDGDDGGDVATPNEVTAGPVSTSFQASPPQVGAIKVSVPSRIVAGQAYNITYATQTDQDLGLYSIVIPAGGSGCAASYELESDDLSNPDDIFSGSSDVYGTQSTKGDDVESSPGSYVICSWIEGPDDEQVDATGSTPIKVTGTATSSSSDSAAGSPSDSSAATGSGKSGTSTAACVVPKLAGVSLSTARQRLAAAGCHVGAIRRVHSSQVKAGRVIRLTAAPGKHLKHGASVGITVSRGA